VSRLPLRTSSIDGGELRLADHGYSGTISSRPR
jgi:hypothetical protein